MILLLLLVAIGFFSFHRSHRNRLRRRRRRRRPHRRRCGAPLLDVLHVRLFRCLFVASSSSMKAPAGRKIAESTGVLSSALASRQEELLLEGEEGRIGGGGGGGGGRAGLRVVLPSV